MIDKVISALDALGARLGKVRHIYTYLTGDPTRAGCLRVLTGLALATYGITAGIQASRGRWFTAAIGMLFGLLLPVTYIRTRRTAEALDNGAEALPLGTRSVGGEARLNLLVVLLTSPILILNPTSWLSGYAIETISLWVAIDGGGNTRRSLAKDLRRLAATATPSPRLGPAPG